MARRRDRAGRIRIGIVAGAAVLAVFVVAFGLWYGRDAAPYRVLDAPDGTGEVAIVAYFSYQCPVCRRFDEALRDWRETLPDGVALRTVHVAYSPSNRVLAKAHLALRRHGAMHNGERIFRAIGDRNRNFPTVQALSDFVDGVDRAAFLRTATSPRVARQVAAHEQEFVALGLSRVPALAVDGKYVINMDLGRKGALAAAADLARELVAGRASAD